MSPTALLRVKRGASAVPREQSARAELLATEPLYESQRGASAVPRDVSVRAKSLATESFKYV